MLIFIAFVIKIIYVTSRIIKQRMLMKREKVKGEYFLIDLGNGLRGEVRKAAVDAKETMKRYIRKSIELRLKNEKNTAY